MPKATSVVAKKVNGIWEIRGSTSRYIKLLKINQCTWDGKKLVWEYTGKTLPLVIQQIVDGTYGAEGLLDAPVITEPAPQVIAAPVIVDIEPDGTCPYMVENQRSLKPCQDWLGWMTCCECGVFLDLESNRKAGSKPLMGLPYGKVICRNCHAAKHNLPEIRIDTPSLMLPVRQVEFLLALAEGKPVAKNAATRKALRTHKLITDTDDWDAIELTAAGKWWIGLNAPIPPLLDHSKTDAWVKQVNEAARAADAAFTESMNMSPVVHLAVGDPDVQEATNKFVQVASSGAFKTVDDLVDIQLKPESTDDASPEQEIAIRVADNQTLKVMARIYKQLAVHPFRTTAGWSLTKWTLTHIKSGRSIIAEHDDKEALCLFAEELGALDFDAAIEKEATWKPFVEDVSTRCKTWREAQRAAVEAVAV